MLISFLFTHLVVGLTYVGDHPVLGKNVHRTSDWLFLSDVLENDLFTFSEAQQKCANLGHGARLMSPKEATKLHIEIKNAIKNGALNRFQITKSFWIESQYELYLDNDERPISKAGAYEKLYVRCVLKNKSSDDGTVDLDRILDEAFTGLETEPPIAITPKNTIPLPDDSWKTLRERLISQADNGSGWAIPQIPWKKVVLLGVIALPVCWKAYCWYSAPIDQKIAQGISEAKSLAAETVAQAINEAKSLAGETVTQGIQQAQSLKQLTMTMIYSIKDKEWYFIFTDSITKDRISVSQRYITKHGYRILVSIAKFPGTQIKLAWNGLNRLFVNGLSVHFSNGIPQQIMDWYSKHGFR